MKRMLIVAATFVLTVVSAAAQHTVVQDHHAISVGSKQELTRQVCSLKPKRYIVHYVQPDNAYTAYESEQVSIAAGNLDVQVFEINTTTNERQDLKVSSGVKSVGMAWSLDKTRVMAMSETSEFFAMLNYPESWQKITADMLAVVEDAGTADGRGSLDNGLPCEQLLSESDVPM